MKKMMFVVALALPLSIATLSAQSAAPKMEKMAKTTGKKVEKKANHGAPAAVKAAFKQRFPTVTKVSYDHEKNGEYEAEFKMDGVKMSANFTPEGAWRETEREIAATALPAAVSQSIAAKYPKATIVGAAKIETVDKGTRYEADLKTGLKKSEVLFDESGNVVK
jgi:Putative beta-lactamase-inhibitor-like, PepSY-like